MLRKFLVLWGKSCKIIGKTGFSDITSTPGTVREKINWKFRGISCNFQFIPFMVYFVFVCLIQGSTPKIRLKLKRQKLRNKPKTISYKNLNKQKQY